MKKLFLFLAVCTLLLAAFAPQPKLQSGITGTIDPPQGARKIWAFSGTDSLSAVPVSGKFTIHVKPGNWNLYVEGEAPYRSTTVANILVTEGHPTDAGLIKMEK